MAPPKQSQDMPFAVGLIFAVVGAVMLVGVLVGFVGPAVWVRFAYRPASGVVLEKRTAEQSAKGGRRYLLEVRIGYDVAGRPYRGWVRLPRSTRQRKGAEADAVQGQLAVG